MSANPIVAMFEWWNPAFGESDGFPPDAFRPFFTEDARLTVNGNLRGQGLEALSRHYRNLQTQFDSIQMELPVLDEFACGDRAFVQCVTVANRAGEVFREEAMAVAVVSAQRISELRVIGRRLD